MLRKVFGYLDQYSGSELILTLGTSGCGKSTMLNSLVYGPDLLHLKDGVVELKDDKNGFKIGHSENQSETCLP